MKKLAYLLVFFVSAGLNTALGQAHSTLKLDKGTKLLKTASVNNGVVLLTGDEDVLKKNLDWKIRYYTPHLAQRYQVPVTNPGVKTLSNCFFVMSPTGNSVYFIRHGEGVLAGDRNKQDLLRIDSSGFTTASTVKDELDYDNVNVVFADDNYLYYVTKEEDKTAINKHAFRKLQFVRIAKDKSISKIMLALPEPEPYATEWSYFGHTAVVSYFVSREFNDINYKDEKFRIAVIGHDGQLLDDFKIDVPLKNGKYMPEYNYCAAEGVHEVNNHNIKVGTSDFDSYDNEDGPITGDASKYSPNPEAYGNIMLDPYTNGFYVYGIEGIDATNHDNHSKKGNDLMPTDYYVYKFDQDGKDVWSYEGKLSGIDDFFKSKAGFTTRQVTLRYGSGGKLRLQAFAAKDVVTYEINPQTGAFISGYSNTFPDAVTLTDLGLCHKSNDKSDVSVFLSKAPKGDYTQLYFRMLTDDIVIRNFYKDSRLEMYDFIDE